MGKPTETVRPLRRVSTASPKMALPPNLRLKHKTWQVSIRVPGDLVPLIGKARLVRSTEEHDIHRAAIKAEPIRAEFLGIIAAARKGTAQGDLEERIRAITIRYREAAAHPEDMTDEVLYEAVHTVLNGLALRANNNETSSPREFRP